jgi:CRISPR type III-B/RAMP module RAMP protein Cmr6
MTAACRKGILNLWKLKEAEPTDSYELPGCANASLVMDKYLRVPVREDEHKKNARRELHQAVQESIDRSEEVYKAAFDRYKNSTPGPCKAGDCKTVEGLRLIIGIGNENVLETGLTLHHTYGTPIIPGTALKGLASHYCDQVWGAGDGKFKRGEEYHRAIFGTSDDSGHFIFHDAWITPETMKRSLRRDVMTPHHMEYYSGEDKGQAAPTDFDDPNPITFLSIVGTFHVAVSCDVPGAEGDKWADLAFRLLTDALREWGIGGKTAAGYGRLVQEVSTQTGAQSIPRGAGVPVGRTQHNKGDIVNVTRTEDPMGRGRNYFVADDGIGGFFIGEGCPPIAIGGTTRLRVKGVHPDGKYDFENPAPIDPHAANPEPEQRPGGRRRR